MIAERTDSGSRTTKRRRGFALLAALLLTVLLISVTTQLAASTLAETVSSLRRSRDLAHELAVESSLLLLNEELHAASRGITDLERTLDERGMAEREWQVGSVAVHITVRDDGGKFNPLFWQRDDQRGLLVRKLSLLQARCGLPAVSLEPRPLITSHAQQPRYRWFDQLISDARPGELFRWSESNESTVTPRVWSDVLTFWGDGRIDLRRADPDVLEAALEDIRPGLGRVIQSERTDHGAGRIMDDAVLISVPAELRSRVSGRITFNARRFAVRLNTAVDADRRACHVVAQVQGDDLVVLHRSPLEW